MVSIGEDMNKKLQGSALYEYCRVFSERLIKVMDQHATALFEASVARIVYEINRQPQSDGDHKDLRN